MNPECSSNCPLSLLGGHQGGEGSIFGRPYAPGSFIDKVIEVYAGPHDLLNSRFWYNPLTGNIRQGLSDAAKRFGEGLNYFNVIPATGFAAASVVQPHTSILLSELNRDDND